MLLLVARGAKIDARDQNEETPLFWAVRADSVENVMILVANGADTEVRNQRGATASEKARSCRSMKTLRMLSEDSGSLEEDDDSEQNTRPFIRPQRIGLI